MVLCVFSEHSTLTTSQDVNSKGRMTHRNHFSFLPPLPHLLREVHGRSCSHGRRRWALKARNIQPLRQDMASACCALFKHTATPLLTRVYANATRKLEHRLLSACGDA